MVQVDGSNHKFIKTDVEVRTEITIIGTIRTGTNPIVVTEDNTDKIKVGPYMKKIIGNEILEEMWGTMVDKIIEESIEAIIEMTVMTEAGTCQEKGHFEETTATILEIGVQSIVGPGQDQEQVQIKTEFSVTSVVNMATLQRTVPLLQKRKK